VSVHGFDPVGMLHTLLDQGVRFVLIGGFAAAMRGSPLMTGDLDVCCARDDGNLRRLAAALDEMHARLRGVDEDVPFIPDAPTLKAGDTFTFVTDLGALDVIGTPSGTRGFDDLDAGATDESIGSALIRVASLTDIARMKRAAGRPKDRVALEWVRGVEKELANDAGREESKRTGDD